MTSIYKLKPHIFLLFCLIHELFGNSLYRVSAEHSIFELQYLSSAIGPVEALSDAYHCMLKTLIHQASGSTPLWVTKGPRDWRHMHRTCPGTERAMDGLSA